MNLPGPTRVFELTYLAEFHGVGKMTAYVLLSAELFVIIRDGSYLLPNAVWNPFLVYDQIFDAQCIYLEKDDLDYYSLCGFWINYFRHHQCLRVLNICSPADPVGPMSRLRSCGSLASGNDHLLRVKSEPQSREDRIKELEDKKQVGCMHTRACMCNIYSLDYFGLSLIVIHSIWWGCAGDMHIYIYIHIYDWGSNTSL